jgi:hypothetical protein
MKIIQKIAEKETRTGIFAQHFCVFTSKSAGYVCLTEACCAREKKETLAEPCQMISDV